MGSANEKRRYTCSNASSHWLSPCSIWSLQYCMTKVDGTNRFNSLTTGRAEFESRIFNLITQNSSLGIHYEMWMPYNLTNKKSTLVQVMAWCHQAASHYLNQCCHRSMLLNGAIRPGWIHLNSQKTSIAHPWGRDQNSTGKLWGIYCEYFGQKFNALQLDLTVVMNMTYFWTSLRNK